MKHRTFYGSTSDHFINREILAKLSPSSKFVDIGHGIGQVREVYYACDTNLTKSVGNDALCLILFVCKYLFRFAS